MSSKSSKHKRDQAVASLKKRQEDLDQLVAMFGSSIPPSTVERIFSANNCDVDQSIEALLAAASVDAEEMKTNKIDAPEVPGKDWLVAGSGRMGKPRENTQLPAPANNQARINASSSRSEKTSQSQNKFSILSHPSSFRSSEDNSSVSKNDYDAFVAWKAPLEDFLSQEDLSDIWNQVRKEYWSEQKNLKRKVEIANIYAQQRIDFFLESNQSSYSPMSQSDKSPSPFSEESSKNLKIDESDYLLSFKRLFVDIISNEQLEEMWRSIRLVDIDLEQKEELAVLYAMEYLEEKEQDNAETMTLLEVLSVQEAQRLERKQELDLKTHLKRENKQSTQDAALQCVLQVFEDTTMKDDITPQEVSKMLISCQYDVEETVARLCQAALQRGNFVRHDASFSEVASVRNESRKSRQGSNKISNSKRILTEDEQPSMKYSQVVKTHRANGNNFSSSNLSSSSSSNKLNPLFRSRMRKDPSYNFRFGIHFLGVLRAKNPLVVADLSEDGEILYKGMKPHHSQRCDGHRNMLFIIIDLHGLPVVQALQVVDSSIDYYRDSFYSAKSTQLADCVTIRFIVGKGLHSPGGIAKIGPAVQRLLKDRGEKDFVPYEGVVVLCIKK